MQSSSDKVVSKDKQKLVDLFFPEFCKTEPFFNEKTTSKILEENNIKSHLCAHSKKCEICNVTLNSPNKSQNVEFLLNTHVKVKDSGIPNYLGCKIPINDQMNIQFMKSMLKDYKDEKICDLLEFGFPLGFQGDRSKILKNVTKKDIWKFKNHKGAEEYPDEMLSYLQKEFDNKAIIGPFKTNPFDSGLKISPLNSLPKEDTSERRVILDLSYPVGISINDFISKEEYMGEKIDLVYPKVDDFIQLIKQKGRGCLLFKKDLRRAFRQIKLCPLDYNLVSFTWKKHIFCDCVLSMGSRSATFCCQRLTNAITFIMFKIGISVLNYLDDLSSAETRENAVFAYNTLGSILEKCGIEESKNKACPPNTIMIFIGVLFNTEKMTIEVTQERLNEMQLLLQTWLCKSTASLKEIQSILGKLNFIAACVRPGRVFIGRLLQWLKVLNKSHNPREQVYIPDYVKKDILWWHKFLPCYNGISLMLYEEWSDPDEICSSDACLNACGGFWSGKYFHASFPEKFNNEKYNITVLEMFAVILCRKLWGANFKGKRIQMFCDNLNVCHCINTGKAKNQILQQCLREVCFIAAVNDIQVRMVHLDSKANRISDHLSRWNLNIAHRNQFFELTKSFTLTECPVQDSLFNFIHTW